MYGAIVGDGAVMSGWLARAQTLLAGRGGVSPRRAGWRSTSACSRATARGRRRASARRSSVGRRFGDRDLEFVALAYLGASLVHADRTEEGMVLLDEALAAVAGSEVDDFCVLRGDLLPAVLGLRARPRRRARRSVDPDR